MDGWRAISVLMVLVFHILVYQHPHVLANHRRISSLVEYWGPLGVRIFFVISGFVICRLLILEERRSGSVSLRAFYCRRAFRIIPPFFTYLAVVSLLLARGTLREHWAALRNAAFFLYDIESKPWSWFVGHTWTLAVEEQFYLLFPAIWVLTRRQWRRKVLCGAFLLCGALNLVLVQTGWDGLLPDKVRSGFSCIGWGVLMAVFEAPARRIGNGFPAIGVVLVACILCAHPVGNLSAWQAALYESFFVPAAIGLLLLLSLSRVQWLRRSLCWTPMQAVGLTSYGIYLWQQLFTAPIRDNYVGSGSIIGKSLPLLCIIVPISYFLIEKPSMRFGRVLLSRTQGTRSERATEQPVSAE